MNTPTILIVDNKPVDLFSLEMILMETKAEIIRAENGKDALVSSLNHDFALALLDVYQGLCDFEDRSNGL